MVMSRTPSWVRLNKFMLLMPYRKIDKLTFAIYNNKQFSILNFPKIVRPSNPIGTSCYLRYIAFCTANINPFLSKGIYHLHQRTLLKDFGNLESYQNNPHLFSLTQSKYLQKKVAQNVLYWKGARTKSALGFRPLVNRHSTTLTVFCCYFY